MRRLTVFVGADADTCGACHRLHVSEDLDKAHRGTCELFGAGVLRTKEGHFNRLVACLNAERIAGESGPPEAA